MLPQLNHSDFLAAEREACSRSLAYFIKRAWQVIEPAQPYVHGWHIDAMAEHLEAVTAEQILRLYIAVPPGAMKPVSVEEPVMTRRGVVRLAEVEPGDYVLTHRGRFKRVDEVHRQGMIPVLTIETAQGRRVTAAPDHPFLTPRGWVQAQDLQPGDYVGSPHRHEAMTGSMSPEEARLLGYLVGDGCISNRSLTFTSGDREVIEDFIRCATATGFYARVADKQPKKNKAKKVILKSTKRPWNSADGEQPVLLWLKAHGLYRSNSYSKFVPRAVLTGGEEAMRGFIGAYWSCDGCISIRHVGRKTSMLSFVTTVSEQLAHDVHAVLTALNIKTRVRRRTRRLAKAVRSQSGERYVFYEVKTSERNEVAKFIDMPGLVGRKNDLAKMAFRDKFDPDIYEDEVLAVSPAGAAECMCLTVRGDHSFTAGGLVVHNSLMTGVFHPAWEWGPKGLTSHRFLGTSHRLDLATRDNLRMRRLVQSEWYWSLWGDTVMLTGDQNAKLKFENTATGFREAMAFTGLTGSRGDRLLMDDVMSVDDANSDTKRESINLTFLEGVPTRLNNPDRSAIINIQQRLHPRDTIGLSIAKELGYEGLVIPMEFEADNRCVTSIGFKDPRTKEGELMFPGRFPQEVVDELKKTLGSFAAASQLQQRPIPRAGGLFKRAWFEIIPAAPADIKWVRGWDLAATEVRVGQKVAFTAGVKLGRTPAGEYVIGHVTRGQLSPANVERLITNTARQDGVSTLVSLPKDPGAAGKTVILYLTRALEGFNVRSSPESGSKEQRAEPVASQCEAGNVKLVAGPWNEEFLAEAEVFPNGTYLDQIDALSRAFSEHVKMNTQVNEEFSAPVVVKGS